MPIKIIPAGTPIPVTALTALVLGQPGSGKTTLANTADRPLLLDFDRGSHRSVARPDTIPVDSWADMAQFDFGPGGEHEGYRTIVVDTIGTCLDKLAVDIMRDDGKLGNSGVLNIRGFGRLKARFSGWVKGVRGTGKHLIFIAHSKEERHGEEVRLRIDGQGSGKEEVYRLADLMGRVTTRGDKPWVCWDPSESGFGKNPAGLPAGRIPLPAVDPEYMKRCVDVTLEHLNRAGEAGAEEEKRLTELRERIKGVKTADGLSEIAVELKEAGTADKQILMVEAKRRGLEWDRKAGGFFDPDTPPEPEGGVSLDELRAELHAMETPEQISARARAMREANASAEEKIALVEDVKRRGWTIDTESCDVTAPVEDPF